jgi:N-methylhydantoinase A
VLSAFGTLVTPLRLDLVRSDLVQLRELDWDRVERLLDELSREAIAALSDAGCAAKCIVLVFAADLRYLGQQSELTVTFDADPRSHRDGERIGRAFEEAYRKLYRVNPSHVPIELVTWRVSARGPAIPFSRAADLAAAPGAARGSRPVHAWQEGQATPVYDRASLAAGQRIGGPAIIEERETTTVIPPGWTATIDPVGCIIARKS